MKPVYFYICLLLVSVHATGAYVSQASNSFVTCEYEGHYEGYGGGIKATKLDLSLKDGEQVFAGQIYSTKTTWDGSFCAGLEGTTSSSKVRVRFSSLREGSENNCDKKTGPISDASSRDFVTGTLSPGEYSAMVEYYDKPRRKAATILIAMLNEKQKKMDLTAICKEFIKLPHLHKNATNFRVSDVLIGEVNVNGTLTLLNPSRANEIIYTAQLPVMKAKLPFKSVSTLAYQAYSQMPLLQIQLIDLNNKKFRYAVFPVEDKYLLSGYGSSIDIIPSQISDYSEPFRYKILENAQGLKRIMLFSDEIDGSYNYYTKKFYLYDLANHQKISDLNVYTRCDSLDFFSGSNWDEIKYFSYTDYLNYDGKYCHSGTEFHYDPVLDKLVFDKRF